MRVGDIIPVSMGNKFHFALLAAACLFTTALFAFGSNQDLLSPVASVFFALMSLFLVLIVIAILIIIYQDNKKRGRPQRR